MKPVDLLVALLVNSDIVLGMPFLKQEKITVDADKNDIILLTPLPEPELLTSTWTTIIKPIASLNKEQTPMIPKSTTTLNPEQAKKWHDNVVKEFSDMFGDKLPALKN